MQNGSERERALPDYCPMRINYDLHDLRALHELARLGSFNRAADALSITPSAPSRRVAKLEAALGGRSVERTTRSMTLTPLGELLLERVRPLLESLEESLQEAFRIAWGLAGKVTVGCMASVAHSLFSAAVVEFHRNAPDVQVCLRDDAGSRVRSMVLGREMEFGATTL
ncbi:LysR family transcriptional regulator [Cupriavidus basilensis]|uniref:LysR family transcriptional regulator n=1 Tax=Cupriavidus basilensis TaxID=68895 RepID=UPI003D3446F7